MISSSNSRLKSRVTPRRLIWLENGIVLPATPMDWFEGKAWYSATGNANGLVRRQGMV